MNDCDTFIIAVELVPIVLLLIILGVALSRIANALEKR
jgi:hypothetical protein